MQTLGDELRFVFITSGAELQAGEGAIGATVAASSAEKCERCWHRREDVGADASHPTLCTRCVENIDGAGEQRQFA